MKKFDKSKTVADRYLPIYANNQFTMVNIECTINSMKALQGFCVCNSLPSGKIAKLQGGYYVLNNDEKWDFLAGALSSLSFEVLFNKLTALKPKVKMDENTIKDTMVSKETLLLIPSDVLQSGILNSGNHITQTVLAKWLREIENIHVTSMPSYIGNKKAKKHYFELSFMSKVMQMGNQFGYYDTYEEALELGLQQALKLVVKRIENES
jgi:hypothetical protein